MFYIWDYRAIDLSNSIAKIDVTIAIANTMLPVTMS